MRLLWKIYKLMFHLHRVISLGNDKGKIPGLSHSVQALVRSDTSAPEIQWNRRTCPPVVQRYTVLGREQIPFFYFQKPRVRASV